MVEAYLRCSSIVASLPFSLGPCVLVKLSAHLQQPTQDSHTLSLSAPFPTDLIVYKENIFARGFLAILQTSKIAHNFSYCCSHFQLSSHNFHLDIY